MGHYAHTLGKAQFRVKPFRHTYISEASFTRVLRSKPALSSPQALHSAELAVDTALRNRNDMPCHAGQNRQCESGCTWIQNM